MGNKHSSEDQFSNNTNPCNICDGSGYNLVLGQYPCSRCAGTGRDYHPGIGLDPGTPCSWCSGSGNVTETRHEQCRHCSGTGRR